MPPKASVAADKQTSKASMTKEPEKETSATKKKAERKEKTRSMLRLKSTTSSLVSVGLGYSNTGPNLSLHQLKSDAGMLAASDRVTVLNQRLTDVLQFYIICPSHKKILLTQSSQNQSLYFPFTTLRTNETVHRELNRRVHEYCQELKIPKDALEESPSLIDLVHLKIPPNQEYINRFTFRLDFKQKAKPHCICSAKLTNVQWLTVDELKPLNNRLWGPEPLLLANKVVQPEFRPRLDEISLEDVCKYLSPALLAQKHPLSMLLMEMGMTETDLERVWVEFLLNCYPSVHMTKYSLQDFMWRPSGSELSAGMLDSQHMFKPEKLIKAFQIDSERSDNYYIDFDEFLFGICFMDPKCSNQEIRGSYLFRYYGQGQDQLTYEQLTNLCSDMELFLYRNPSRLKDDGLRKTFDAEIDAFADTNASNRSAIKLTYAQFLAKFKSLKKTNRYFNMEVLWRVSKSLSTHFRALQQLDGFFLNRNLREVVRLRNGTMCASCLDTKRTVIAEYTVKTGYSGNIEDIMENRQWVPSAKRGTKLQRVFSKLFFLPEFFANMLLNSLTTLVDELGETIRHNKVQRTRSLVAPVKSKTEPNHQRKADNDSDGVKSQRFRWSSRFTQTFHEKLLELAQQADLLMAKDHGGGVPVLRLKSPVIVIPAYQGKLITQIVIEQSLSYLATLAFPIKYVLCLDWSNLQTKGVELLFYWIAHKLLLPNHYFLIFEGTGTRDGKAADELRLKLMKQIQEQFPSKTEQISQALLNILTHASKMLVVDDSVGVISEVNSVDQTARDLMKQYQTANLRPRVSIEMDIEIRILVVVRSGQDCLFHVKSYEPSLEKGGNCIAKYNLANMAKITGKNYIVVVLLLDNEKIRAIYL